VSRSPTWTRFGGHPGVAALRQELAGVLLR